ncbi:hypothetical protein EZY14_003330 [Kordia sp. TARA_039_SRF]|nr:hypothetical protein EZY14_003330 [Kordia sp. TARA_039_SRF]
MKKRNLKSLKLNKRIITNDESLKGGTRDITDPTLDPDADCAGAPADTPASGEDTTPLDDDTHQTLPTKN